MTETIPHKHPYADKLEKTMIVHKRKLFLYQEKLRMIKESILESQSKTYPTEPEVGNTLKGVDNIQFKLNDLEITAIETEGQIDILQRVISEKEKYFKGYMEQFIKDVDDANKHLKNTIHIAMKSKNEKVQNILNTPGIFDRIDNDDEAKIEFYKTLRKYV